jgi:hypothetical protein
MSSVHVTMKHAFYTSPIPVLAATDWLCLSFHGTFLLQMIKLCKVLAVLLRLIVEALVRALQSANPATWLAQTAGLHLWHVFWCTYN